MRGLIDRALELQAMVPAGARVVDRSDLSPRFPCGRSVYRGHAPRPGPADRLGVPRATLSDDFRIMKGILEELKREENPEV
jgi:hypothetical protein